MVKMAAQIDSLIRIFRNERGLNGLYEEEEEGERKEAVYCIRLRELLMGELFPFIVFAGR